MKIFLSYKRNVEPDEPLAREVYAALRTVGHEVFLDQVMLTGIKWAEEIERQIRQMPLLDRVPDGGIVAERDGAERDRDGDAVVQGHSAGSRGIRWEAAASPKCPPGPDPILVLASIFGYREAHRGAFECRQRGPASFSAPASTGRAIERAPSAGRRD